MSVVTFRVEGFRNLDRALEELEKLATRRAVARRALIKAAEPTAELMRLLAPDDPSTANYDLVESIGVGTRLSERQKRLHRRMFRNERAAVEAFVGAGPVPHAHLQEFGTEHHAPQPFARPAWEADKMAILQRLGREMWGEIRRTVERVRRRQVQG